MASFYGQAKNYGAAALGYAGGGAEKLRTGATAWAVEANANLRSNPGRTIVNASWDVAKFSPLLLPGLVWGPVLGAVGFGATGVGAGTTAAAIQSQIGVVAAGSPFAFLQSAAAGGYGAAAMDMLIQGGFIAWNGVAWVLKRNIEDPPAGGNRG